MVTIQGKSEKKMYFVRRDLLTCVFFLLPFITFSQNQKLTLQEAFQKALSQNEELKAENLKTENAELTSENTFYNRLPTIKVSGRVSRLSEVDPFLIHLPIMPTAIEIAPSIQNQYAMKATVTQPLFTGFKLEKANEAAEYLSKSSQQDLLSKQSDLQLKVAQAYVNVIGAEQVLKILNKNSEQLSKRLLDAEQLKKQGLLTDNDVLKIQVKVNDIEVSKIQSENNIKVAKMNLNILIGESVDSDYELEFPKIESAAPAQGKRSELVSLDYKLKATESSLDAAYGDWYPSLSFQFNYDYARPNTRIFPQKDEWKSTWDANLVLSFDLWNWGIRSNTIQIAKNQFKSVEMGKQQLEKVYSMEEISAEYSLEKSTHSIEVLQKQVEQVNLNLKISENQYQAGILSTTELLDAQILSLQADIQLLQMQLDHTMNQLKLMKARGVLK